MQMKSSRLSGFYRQSVHDRLRQLEQEEFIIQNDFEILKNGGLSLESADKLIENVIGLFNLPLAIATNFTINGKDRLVAMCIEEPSVVAAASNAARLVRESGGFKAEIESHLMTSQVELRRIKNTEQAIEDLEKNKEEIIAECRRNSCNIEDFGGGVKEIEIREINLVDGEKRLVVHIHVDCADAMGANTINTIAEKVAPLLESITGGEAGLRILTNLSDRRIVTASCRVNTSVLASYRGAKEVSIESGEIVRDLVIEAFKFADSDPYRAVTHNKGIMNGIDAVLIATGNDWRAVEAGAHAMACISGKYRSLTKWVKGDDGSLEGYIRLPMAVGIVGGMTKFHKCAELALKIMEISSAKDLEMVIACTGLASNLAALLALSTEGIQRGHMRLHQRHTV